MSPHSYESLKALSKELRRPVATLYALSPDNDPFYAGSPANRIAAEWFAGLWERFDFSHGAHLRRIHYRVISQPLPVLLPNGEPYENTDLCWNKLGHGAKMARYLGLVPADAIIDRKNPAPRIYLPEDDCTAPPSAALNSSEAPDWRITSGKFLVPSLPCPPSLFSTVGSTSQRYHIEIWIEKSTVHDVLEPIARRHGANLCTFTGETSIHACRQLVRRAKRSGRPCRVLYISDFDPGGMSMPVAAARKIEFAARLEHEAALDVQVRPIALTYAQCVDLKLPRTPIKETEKRAANFEGRFGAGATELDALEALHPGELARMVRGEIGRYYDPTLKRRQHDAEDEIAAALSETNAAVHREYAAAIAELKKRRALIAQNLRVACAPHLRAAKQEWDALAEDANALWQAMEDSLLAQAPDVSGFHWPEAAEGEEDPDPLFDSRRDYLTQVERYKRHQGKPIERRKRNGRANGGAP